MGGTYDGDTTATDCAVRAKPSTRSNRPFSRSVKSPIQAENLLPPPDLALVLPQLPAKNVQQAFVIPRGVVDDRAHPRRLCGRRRRSFVLHIISSIPDRGRPLVRGLGADRSLARTHCPRVAKNPRPNVKKKAKTGIGFLDTSFRWAYTAIEVTNRIQYVIRCSFRVLGLSQVSVRGLQLTHATVI